MSREPYDPDTTLGALQRLGDALRVVWWEVVYACRLDVLVRKASHLLNRASPPDGESESMRPTDSEVPPPPEQQSGPPREET